jgi:lysophospholipase L1-like esterase
MSSMSYRHIASLGSSFAAGPSIEPVADRAARRSARNYPHLLAARLGAELTDLTVSGATTDTILDTPQRVLNQVFPPQLQGLPADVDLVTITAGGNDLKYASSMVRFAMAGLLSSHLITRPLGVLIGRGQIPRPDAADLDRTARGLARVVASARDRAPGARVLLVDYLTVFGADTRPSRDVPLDRNALDALRRLGDSVTEVFAMAAERSGAELVRLSQSSRDHALGSLQPWVTGLPSRRSKAAPFHPNADGMQGAADTILGHLEAAGDAAPGAGGGPGFR